MASLDIPGELYTQLQAKAEVEGQTVDELVLEALRDRLTRETFTTRVTRLRNKNADGVEYTPERVSGIIHDWREEQHGR